MTWQSESTASMLTLSSPIFQIGSRKHGRGSVLFSWDPSSRFLASTGTSKVVHIHREYGRSRVGSLSQSRSSLPGQNSKPSLSTASDYFVLHRQITPPGSSVCRALEWDRLGQYLAIIQENSPSLILWHAVSARRGSNSMGFGATASGEQILNISGREYLTLIKWSQVGNQLAVGTSRGSMIIYDPTTGSLQSVSETPCRVLNTRGGDVRAGANANGGAFQMGSGSVLDGAWNKFSNLFAWVTEDRYLHICSDDGCILGSPRRLKSKPVSISFGASAQDSENDCILAVNLSGRSLLIYNTCVPSRAVELRFEENYGRIVSHQWDSKGRVLVAFSKGFLSVVSMLAGSLYREQSCIRLHDGASPMFGFAFCNAKDKAATCDANTVRLVDSNMFCEDLHELVVPDLAQGTLDRISLTKDGSVLTISDKSGSLFSYAIHSVENQDEESTGLIGIATGPVALMMKRMSEPISLGRMVLTLLLAGIFVTCLTASGMEAQTGTFVRAIFGMTQVL